MRALRISSWSQTGSYNLDNRRLPDNCRQSPTNCCHFASKCRCQPTANGDQPERLIYPSPPPSPSLSPPPSLSPSPSPSPSASPSPSTTTCCRQQSQTQSTPSANQTFFIIDLQIRHSSGPFEVGLLVELLVDHGDGPRDDPSLGKCSGPTCEPEHSDAHPDHRSAQGTSLLNDCGGPQSPPSHFLFSFLTKLQQCHNSTRQSRDLSPLSEHTIASSPCQ